jgi:hypothetical protein
MKKRILPAGWEISELTVAMTNLEDIDHPQSMSIKFEDIGGGFFPTVTTSGNGVGIDPHHLKALSELANKTCKTLDYMVKCNDESLRKQ